jgi:hypothetical protein
MQKIAKGNQGGMGTLCYQIDENICISLMQNKQNADRTKFARNIDIPHQFYI